jgi:hypothetical protein
MKIFYSCTAAGNAIRLTGNIAPPGSLSLSISWSCAQTASFSCDTTALNVNYLFVNPITILFRILDTKTLVVYYSNNMAW